MAPASSTSRSPQESAADCGVRTEELRRWAEQSGLLDDARNRELLSSARPELVAAHLYPAASPAGLALAARWLTVNFLVDDLLDDEDDPARCAAYASALLRMFDPRAAAEDVLQAAVADLWERTAAGRSPGWCAAFRADHSDWLDTYAGEAADRASGVVPEVEAYIRHRRLSSGMLVFTDLVEIAAGVDLPVDVRGRDPVRALRATTAEYMGLVNDIHSVGKELASGQTHNLVCVVMRHAGVDIDAATLEVRKALDERLRSFDAAALSIHPGGAAARCVEGYRMLMRGAQACCAELDRYAQAPAGTAAGDRL